LGDSFAAGTTDGPGDFDFTQGTNSSSTNPYWNFIAEFIADAPQDQVDCHYPKPILLYTGGADYPGPWTPAILPLQIFQIGQLFLVGVPGEFTTMSGRRLRNTVKEVLIENGAADNNSYVVIAGLSNAYSHYIATPEEYEVQRYEAASTLYGPNTLPAYQQLYSELATALAKGTPYPPGPTPPDLTNYTFTFPIPQLPDEAIFHSYGDVYEDVSSSYSFGDTVVVSFVGGNPNNDFRTQDTYLTVEMEGATNWTVVLTDGDWDTKYNWYRTDLVETIVVIQWHISSNVEPGNYRIRTFGIAKDVLGMTHPYTGESSTFAVN